MPNAAGVEMVHQFNPDMQPDDDFSPGELANLVVGNRGRLLDPRRTPIRIVDIAHETGHFVVEIEAFEDKGARWEIPFERVVSYQFEQGGHLAPPNEVKRYEETVRRFDQQVHLDCDPTQTARTREMLEARRHDARAWLAKHSHFFDKGSELPLDSRHGAPALFADLRRWMQLHEVFDLEEAFAERTVSNPYSGELVKGHRIVLAELGLVPYADAMVRDPKLFEGPWSRERRIEHILSRLAFVHAVFERAGHRAVTLYRGLSFEGTPEPPRNHTFVSASFDVAVAHSCFAPPGSNESGMLMRQSVPVERLFMTYVETEPMNRHFREAEAVLLFETANPLF